MLILLSGSCAMFAAGCRHEPSTSWMAAADPWREAGRDCSGVGGPLPVETVVWPEDQCQCTTMFTMFPESSRSGDCWRSRVTFF